MTDELAMLRDMLEGAEEDLIRYKAYKGSGIRLLEANYAHKVRQIEDLKQRIAKIEEENKKCSSPGN